METTPGTQTNLYAALRAHFLQAEEHTICHARPSQIAHPLNVSTRSALETLVDAMFAGDAILHWELECPMCKATAEIADPFQVPLHAMTCKACGAHFSPHADQETQVTFSPHPTLRDLDLQIDGKPHLHELHQQFPPTSVHELMTVQKFRDWAQNEPLPPGEYLAIKKITMWFSDLTGSTALYARNGDPLAYNLVRAHFDLVTAAIQQAAGAVVKTIGDGVMAVFTTAKQGLQAALDANQRLEAFNAANNLEGDRCLSLKIGIHTGPAIVVTLNEHLDYFGTTVNIASRVSNLAKGKEVMLTQAACTAELTDMMSAYKTNFFEINIHGLEDRIAVCHIQLAPKPEASRKGLLGFLDRLGANLH